ncbi:MAG: hypothetical protein ACE5IK_07835 [Acidobacteriota bacterium]
MSVWLAWILVSGAGGVLPAGSANAAPVDMSVRPGQRPLGFQERVACQRAIEDVYWRHRLWPAENPGPKPPLDAVLSVRVLQDRVREQLKTEALLASVWHRRLTAAELAAELARMARDSHDPALLHELWAALDLDAQRVADCLARPLLADRLARRWYAFDDRFHGDLRRRAGEELASHPTADQLRLAGGSYQETELRRRPDAGPAPRLAAGSGRLLDPNEWAVEQARLRGLFTSSRPTGIGPPRRGDLRAGMLSSLQEDAQRFYVIGIVERDADHLVLASVEWPKVPFDAWLEQQAPAPEPGPSTTSLAASSLTLPAISGTCSPGTWTALPFVPEARDRHVAVWTGAEMIVWGGNFVEPAQIPGGRYDPATDTWRPLQVAGAPSTRQHASAVWTGTEMIVWGGWGGGTDGNVKNSGARYDPLLDAWSPTSTAAGATPTPRTRHTAVWTGSEMIVWGGCAAAGCLATLGDGGRYDPVADQWAPVAGGSAPAARYLHSAVWTGQEMAVWGGEQPGIVFDDGARYDPISDTWAAMASAGAPQARSLHSAVWTGDRMIVWGGCRTRSCTFPLLASGGLDRDGAGRRSGGAPPPHGDLVRPGDDHLGWVRGCGLQ